MADLEAPEAVVLLRRIVDLLEGLPQAIAAASRSPGAALSKKDRISLAVLLRAINDAIGHSEFTAGDLLQEAKDDSQLDSALRKALGELDGNASNKLGKLLSRADGFVSDDLVAKSTANTRAGRVWSVTRLS